MHVELELSNGKGNSKMRLFYHIFPSPDDPNVVDLYLHNSDGDVVASIKDTDLTGPGDDSGAFDVHIPPGRANSLSFTVGVVESKTQNLIYESQPLQVGDSVSGGSSSSISVPMSMSIPPASPTHFPPPVLDSSGGPPPPPPPPPTSTSSLNFGTPIIMPPSAPPSPPPTMVPSSGARTTNLVPVGIGVLILVVVLGIAGIFMYRRRRQRQLQQDTLPRNHKYKRTPTPLVPHSNLRASGSTTSLVPHSTTSTTPTLFEPEKDVADDKQLHRTTAEFEKHRRRNTLFSGSSLFGRDDEDDLGLGSKSDESKSNERLERFRQSRPPPYASILGAPALDPFSDDFNLRSSHRESSPAVDGD